MWSPNPKNITPNEEFDEENEYDDDAWELTRAFVEDTRNTNWPPRSYTCTFCRREFRSAQALGGHMNIHRRDRARQAQAQAQDPVVVTGSTSFSGFFYGGGGGDTSGLFYGQLSNYGANYGFQSVNSLNSFGVSYNPLLGDNVSHNYEESNYDIVKINKEERVVEELDLELRLGHIPTSDGGLIKKNNDNNGAVFHWR